LALSKRLLDQFVHDRTMKVGIIEVSAAIRQSILDEIHDTGLAYPAVLEKIAPARIAWLDTADAHASISNSGIVSFCRQTPPALEHAADAFSMLGMADRAAAIRATAKAFVPYRDASGRFPWPPPPNAWPAIESAALECPWREGRESSPWEERLRFAVATPQWFFRVEEAGGTDHACHRLRP
jgi:hypothetical protein